MSTSVAARLEARSLAATTGDAKPADNATVGSLNHAAAAAFLAKFETRRRNIEDALSNMAVEKEKADKAAKAAATAGSAASAGMEDSSSAAAAAALKDVTAQIASLSLDTSAHVHLLPAYDVRATKTALAALDEALAAAQAALQPRKKFAFRKKTLPFASTPAGLAVAAAAAAVSASAASPAAAASVPAGGAAAPAVYASAAAAVSETPEDPVHGFYRQTGRVLVKSGGVCAGVDVVLSHLRDCVVFILDPPLALRCHNLVNCHVYCAPVSGSVLIYGARSCSLHVATRQLRIHDTHHTSFHLHALSAPIIEHTDTTAFGPLDFQYPALQEHMTRAGLAATQSRHATVEDFNWLRTQQSPNWCLLGSEADKDPAAPQRPPPISLSQAQIDALKNMRDDEQIDEQTTIKLDQLVKELSIPRMESAATA